MTQNGQLASWQGQIKRAAKSVTIQWPDLIEVDDLAQEINLRLVESPGSIQVLDDMDDGVRYRALVEIGHQLAAKARDAYDRFKGEFRYSVGEVERLMKAVGKYWTGQGFTPFSVSELTASWSAGDIISTGRGVHSDPTADVALERLQSEAVRKDLLEALERLNEGYRSILVRRYVDGERGFNEADQKRSERALVELTHQMNHSRKRQHVGKLEPGKTLGDGPGTRKVISNETARAISQSNWDAEYGPAPNYHRDNNTEKEVWEL